MGKHLLAAAAWWFGSVSAAAQWSVSEEAQLLDTLPGTGFASAVDIDGATCVAGFPRFSSNLSGRAKVYRRAAGVWTHEQTLAALDDDPVNGLGCSLALEGDTLVVGARGAQTSGLLGAGAAYVFVRSGSTWTQQAKLVASDPQQQAEFGYAVALSGNTCAVGAPQSTTGNIQFGGATYVFVRSGASWTLQ